MRHLFLSTAAAATLCLGSVAASAQTVPPVPNASGSQVTNPAGTQGPGATNMEWQMRQVAPPATTGSVAPVPNASGSQTTNPAATGSTASDQLNIPGMGAGMGGVIAPPPPNASGSLTTNPAGNR